jgi:hypothetical protein
MEAIAAQTKVSSDAFWADTQDVFALWLDNEKVQSREILKSEITST